MLRLKPFHYFEPTTMEEAVEILTEQGDEAQPLAGGTDLLVRIKRERIAPSALVNVKRIPGLSQIREEPGSGVIIGASATISALAHAPVIQAGHPVLGRAAAKVGSPSIRNLGTIGGNIGRASPASDMAPPLMVLGARIAIRGPSGKKERPLEEIFAGPGSTTLERGELITAFSVPETAPRSGAAYLKLGRRKGMDVALVGIAALVTMAKGDTEAEDAKIAMASVGPVPLRATRAEEVLLSGPLDEGRIREAARAAAEDALPISDMRASASFRREMVRVLTYRALLDALQSARGGNEG